MILLLLLSCSKPDPVPLVTSEVLVPLGAERLARRISLDLRGELPSPEELGIASQDGGTDELIEQWLADPAFEEHMVDVVAETWLLRLDELRVDASEFGLDPDTQTYAFTRAVGNEPARLAARIVAQDRPWTDIVTADFTLANPTLAELVQIEWIEEDQGQEWREARYTDSRPAGGVLMTSGMWLRYHTTLFNYNRGRAAAIARLFLCYDFLARPVDFSALEDNSTEGLAEAVSTNTSCQACHSSLDPLASSLFGFYPFEDKDGVELMVYHPEREGFSESAIGTTPGYFGTPIDAVVQLGQLVASDPRFHMCTAQRTAERLWGRETDVDDTAEIAQLRDALKDSGFDYKELLRATLATEEYRAGSMGEGATEADQERYQPLRLMSPTTMASAVEQATGFRWEAEGWDQLDSDHTGYRVLLGGADGDAVRRSSLEPTTSRSLVIRRLAQAAGAYVVANDLAVGREERRLVGTTVEDPGSLEPGTDPFAAELEAIHLSLLSLPPTADEVAAESELYGAVRGLEGEEAAWASVVSVLLRDPDFWSY